VQALTDDVCRQLMSALNGMLTFFGMDEDENSKPTFEAARQAYEYARIVLRPLEPHERESLAMLRETVHRWHEAAVALGFDGVASLIDLASTPAQQPAEPDGLFEFLAHGDDAHRAWLLAAIRAFFAGQPRPEPVMAALPAQQPAEPTRPLVQRVAERLQAAGESPEEALRLATEAVAAHEEKAPAENEDAALLEALILAEDVLSRSPYSNHLWTWMEPPMHPNEGIGKIRDAIRSARKEQP
jgi:hypothetical protein